MMEVGLKAGPGLLLVAVRVRVMVRVRARVRVTWFAALMRARRKEISKAARRMTMYLRQGTKAQ